MQQHFFTQKLLFVDDDESTRILIKEIFSGTTISVIEAATSNEAMVLFHQHCKEIGLVVIDISLPDTDGFGLLKLLRKVNPCLTAIAISAMEPTKLAQYCLASGFNAFLAKPFEIETLDHMVFNYLYLFRGKMERHKLMVELWSNKS